MQYFGIDPVNPDAKALLKNLNPSALIKFALNHGQGIMSMLKGIIGAPNASQAAFFAAQFPNTLTDFAWSLETIDAAIGPSFRTVYASDAALLDGMLDIVYEDLIKASQLTGTVGQAAKQSLALWGQMKANSPDGSARVSRNETKIRQGSLDAAFTAARTLTKTAFLPQAEKAARKAYLTKVLPGGVSPDMTTIQYATGGAGTLPKKTSPLMIAGIAVAGYLAYKSFA